MGRRGISLLISMSVLCVGKYGFQQQLGSLLSYNEDIQIRIIPDELRRDLQTQEKLRKDLSDLVDKQKYLSELVEKQKEELKRLRGRDKSREKRTVELEAGLAELQGKHKDKVVLPNNEITPSHDVGSSISEPSVVIKSEEIHTATRASRTSDQFENPMIQCRLDLEKKLNSSIDVWLQNGQPILDWVSILPDGMLRIAMLKKHLTDTEVQYGDMRKVTWMCGNDHYAEPATYLRQGPLLELLCNQTSFFKQSNGNKEIKLWPTGAKTEPIYDLYDYMKCDELEMKELRNPKQDIEIGACHIRFGDIAKDNLRFMEWYQYHHMIGVDHFLVYVGAEFNTTLLPPLPNVTYIPYNYRWNDHKKISHTWAPMNGDTWWQEAMITQCQMKMKQLGVRWFVTIDIDEFIEVRHSDFKDTDYPLRSLLEQYKNDTTNIGGLRMQSVPFGPATQTKVPPDLQMDHVTRFDDTKGGAIDRSRPKIIFNAQVCEAADIHWRRRGGRTEDLKTFSEIVMHHYRRTQRGGIYSRVRNHTGVRMEDTRMRDKYRERVCHELRNPIYSHVINMSAFSCE